MALRALRSMIRRVFRGPGGPRGTRLCLLAVLLVAGFLLTACPAIPLGDPLCSWRATLTAWRDENGNGLRDPGEPPVPNARFTVVEVTGEKRTTRYLGSDADGEAVLDHPGVGVCPDRSVVSAEAPSGYTLTGPKEVTLAANTATSADFSFIYPGDDGTWPATPTPYPAADMTCYTAPVLRGALTGRLLTGDGDLWVTRIDRTQPVSRLRSGQEVTLTIPGLTEARDPTIGPDGALWVAGGIDGGVARYDGQSWKRYGAAEGLPADDAFSFDVAGGRLWAFTWEGPARFDEGTGRWEAFPTLGKASQVFEGGDGTLWFADGPRLLQVAAGDPGALLETAELPPRDAGALNAFAAVQTPDAALWMIVEEDGQEGLARYDPAQGTWTRYTYETTGGALPVADFRDLTVLPDGSLFVTARAGGFRLIPGGTGSPLDLRVTTYPGWRTATDPAAVRATVDPALMAALVDVNDASGYDRLCTVQ